MRQFVFISAQHYPCIPVIHEKKSFSTDKVAYIIYVTYFHVRNSLTLLYNMCSICQKKWDFNRRVSSLVKNHIEIAYSLHLSQLWYVYSFSNQSHFTHVTSYGTAARNTHIQVYKSIIMFLC